jgi:regulator of nucleoside diphosphate kinase
MDTNFPIERTLTQTDHARLTRLLSRSGQPQLPATEAMQDMLDSSDVVPAPKVPATVVTMYTQALLADEQEGTEFKITLCYPPDANPSTGQVSVLSPIGAAVLGLSVGETASWHAPTGEERRARILSILFQPEAAGDYLR